MRKGILLVILLWSNSFSTRAQQPVFSSKVLIDSLFIPWQLIYGPDDHIWFTQKNGYICRMDTAGHHTDTLYHEPTTVVDGESGMLGMAMHPDFANNPYLYVAWEYLNPANEIRERVERYTYTAATNSLAPSAILIDSIPGYRFHNGCRVLIVEDKMFITVADATDQTNPQSLKSINGKILRINLDGSIPADNPIAGSPIWTWGHRNPQGLVYAHNILYSSEHGPDTDDEVNIIMKGRNYGWPNVLGYCDQPYEQEFCKDSNVVQPLHAWTPTVAPCGINYYHHGMFPTLQNSLLLTTLKDEHLYQLQLNDAFDSITGISILDSVNFGRLRDICFSPEGKIFISTSNSNKDEVPPKIDRIIVLYNPQYRASDQGAFLLYPNPATDNLYMSVPGSFTRLDFAVYTSDGRRVSKGNLPVGRPRLSVATLVPGAYYIVVKTDNGSEYKGSFIRP